MLAINRLLEYQYELVDFLRTDGVKMFNYTDMIIDDSELALVLKERSEEDNTFLISVMPSFVVSGQEDNSKWKNLLQFFILDKTDYSEHDRDAFRNIFVTTQIKAQALVFKLLEDKSNAYGPLCGFLNMLDENSIRVDPVWKMNGCNGWTIEINLDTPM